MRKSGESLAAIVRLLQFVTLDHGAHGAIQYQDALAEQAFQLCGLIHISCDPQIKKPALPARYGFPRFSRIYFSSGRSRRRPQSDIKSAQWRILARC
jgi:hypothetical protein